MKIKELSTSVDKVKNIAHCADIHIRLYNRHEEYREVFSKLYQEIRNRWNKNSVIVVPGDVVHNKTEMGPELVELVSEFLINLSNIGPVVLIPGNHDDNLSNSSRLDTLSPIVKNIQHENLFYIKETGLWRIGDAVFSHFSQYDSPENYIKASEIPDKYKKIALYHGVVDKSETDTGFILENADIDISSFSGYDLGLLGDIHKRQFLNLNETVGFSGSLIQQNHGEGLEHGFLWWDVENLKSEFVEVENNYGYYTLYVNSGAVPLSSKVPNKPRLRLKISDTPAGELKRVVADIRKFYNVQELTINRANASGLNRNNSGSKGAIDVGNVSDPSHQSNLISDFIKRNHNVKDKTLKKISKINKDLNKKLSHESSHNNIRWRLKEFEWDNMFSYGEGNKINFESMSGITGLFAENAAGKSSLLDAISFCLFDKCNRAYKSTEIVNNKSDWMRCKATFEIENATYVIERKGEYNNYGNLPIDVDFYKIENGEKQSLNGNQRYDTNKNIRKYIGEYEDFILTALSVQGNNTIFVDMGQSERKDLLSKFIGIDVFDKLKSLAKSEVKDARAVIKEYDDEDLSKEIAQAEKEYEENKKQYDDLRDKKKDLSSEKRVINSKIVKKNRSLLDVPNEKDLNIKALRKKEKTLKKEHKEAKEKRKSLEIKKREKQHPLKGFKEMIKSIDKEEIEKGKDKYEDAKSKEDTIQKSIKRLKDLVETVESEIDHLKGHEFDLNCEYCVSRNKKDAQKLDTYKSKNKRLKEDLEEKNKELDKTQKIIKNNKENKENYDKYIKIKNKISNLESEVNALELNATRSKNNENELFQELTDVASDVSVYEKNKEAVEHNETVNAALDTLEDELQQKEIELENIESEIQTKYSNIKVSEKSKEEAKKAMSKYKTLSDKINAYDLYIEAVSRDGVPYELIDKTMPVIEEEVNNILSQIVDFGIVMNLDGSDINAYIMYDENNFWPVSLISGMERFITSLAIRVALINICNLPRPEFIAIDEGFGSLDSENISNINMLFDYLKMQFNFCIIISHIDVMRDMVNGLIEIKNEEDKSKIEYL